MSATETLAKQHDETAAGFHQSWFPLALASELGSGQVMGRDHAKDASTTREVVLPTPPPR